MKKAMLFLVALLFSVSASAASLTISTYDANGATQKVNVSANGSDEIQGYGKVISNPWYSLFDVISDEDTQVKVSLAFKPEPQLVDGEVIVTRQDNWTIVKDLEFDGNVWWFNVHLFAGVKYAFDIFEELVPADTIYSLKIRAVPAPAAAFLLAPALLGLFGLRRKAKLTVA
jgi:uncharacterized protein YxeA